MLGFLKSLIARRQATPQDDLYGRSGQWPRVRREHLEREPRCAACGRDKNLEVHHILPVAESLRIGKPELELDPKNLITLCSDPCHFVHGHLMSWSRWSPSVRADCAAYAAKLVEAKRRASS